MIEALSTIMAALALIAGIYAVLHMAAWIGALLAHLVKPLVHA